jgi:hypothetical protein
VHRVMDIEARGILLYRVCNSLWQWRLWCASRVVLREARYDCVACPLQADPRPEALRPHISFVLLVVEWAPRSPFAFAGWQRTKRETRRKTPRG